MYNDIKEWNQDVMKIEIGSTISEFMFSKLEKILEHCPTPSNELDQAKFFLKQLTAEITKHNELMQKTANKMKLESFKVANIKGYSI